MHKTLGAFVVLAVLSGCVTEQPAKGVALNKLQASCAAYGFQAGTDAYNACVFQLDQQRMTTARDKRMAVADSLGQIGAGMQASASRRTSCTLRRIGNTIYQDCY